MFADRDLAKEYARRYRMRRRRWGETAADFRYQVVRALYDRGELVAAEQVLLNDDQERKAVVVHALGDGDRGEVAVRELAERIQAAVEQARPRRRALWPGSPRPRIVQVNIDLWQERVSTVTALDLAELIIERIRAALEQARPRRRALWRGGSRPVSVHVSVNPEPERVPLTHLAAQLAERGIQAAVAQTRPRIVEVIIDLERPVDPERQQDPSVTGRDLAEEYVGRFQLEPRRDDETGPQFRERVARELLARDERVAAQEVLFNELMGDGWLAEALLEHSGGDNAVRWIVENTQAALEQARRRDHAAGGERHPSQPQP